MDFSLKLRFFVFKSYYYVEDKIRDGWLAGNHCG